MQKHFIHCTYKRVVSLHLQKMQMRLSISCVAIKSFCNYSRAFLRLSFFSLSSYFVRLNTDLYWNMQWKCSLCSLRMFRQGTRVVVSKLVTTQASAAQQRLSGFKITLRISAAHLQYDDTDCRRALRAFRWAIYKRAHKPTTCPVAPSHVTMVQGRSQFLLSWHRKKMPAVMENKSYVSPLCVVSEDGQL